MLPLTDMVRPKRLPVVTIALIIANVAVWLAYEVPGGVDSAVKTIGSRACSLNGSCPDSQAIAWPYALFTAMFGHASWAHIVGNMVFLAVFGPRVEDRFGRVRFLLVYLLAGLGADALFDGTTLGFGSATDAAAPGIGASGAISGVLAAYVVAHPFERILVWTLPALFLRIPALGLLGVWFILQALEGAYALSNPNLTVGTAFMAHVGGFLVGALAQLAYDGRLGPPPRPTRWRPRSRKGGPELETAEAK
jgi:membrane associated rhomboid family serine protease